MADARMALWTKLPTFSTVLRKNAGLIYQNISNDKLADGSGQRVSIKNSTNNRIGYRH